MNLRSLPGWLAIWIVLLAGIPAIAAEEQPCEPFRDGRVDPDKVAVMLSAAEEGHLYRIETERSRVGFCVNSSVRRVEGSFQQFQGGVALDPYGIENEQVLVHVRTDSLDTDCPFTKNIIKGVNFFNVEEYPEILFVSTDFRWMTASTALLEGDLTMHGMTRPVTLNLEVLGTEESQGKDPDRIAVKASTTINRSDFGMTRLQSMVDDTVQLCMDINARRYYRD